MKTIQMEIDDELLEELDRVTRATGTTPSEFIHNMLQRLLQRPDIEALEKQHHEGYEKLPLKKDEISEWETEQVWGDKGKFKKINPNALQPFYDPEGIWSDQSPKVTKQDIAQARREMWKKFSDEEKP